MRVLSLFHSSKVFIHVDLKIQKKESGTDGSKRSERAKPVILNLFVKIVPEHLSTMVMRHRLFQREIVFYRHCTFVLNNQIYQPLVQ